MASMSVRGIAGFLLGLLVVGILVGLGVGVYQAGIAQGIVDAGRYPAGAGVPVAGYGYGWHGGPGIFGILFGIFFLFLVFGLLRAAFFRGRGGPGWGHRGYGYGWGPGWSRGDGTADGPDAWRAERDRRMADLHRRLHEEADLGPSGPGGSAEGGPPAR
jgi:hypothetical protein